MEEEGGGLSDHGVGVVLVDREETSSSSLSTSGSDTSSGGLPQVVHTAAAAACWASLTLRPPAVLPLFGQCVATQSQNG